MLKGVGLVDAPRWFGSLSVHIKDGRSANCQCHRLSWNTCPKTKTNEHGASKTP